MCDVLVGAGLNLAVSQNFVRELVGLAEEIENKSKRRSKPNHWLCEVLATAIDALDPSTISSAVGRVFADKLRVLGMPNWLARVVGWGVSKAAEAVLENLWPGVQLKLGLVVLGGLACPDPGKCPAEDKMTVSVIRGLLEYDNDEPL